jgi:hypothetical protein
MRSLILVGLMILAVACDTTRNTPDPEDNFFMRFYGNDGDQLGVDMLVSDDGSIILLGNSKLSSESPNQIYLVKVNRHGIVQWEKTFSSPNEQIAKDIAATADGNYVIVGDELKATTGTDFLIFTVDAQGNKLFSGTFSYTGNSIETVSSVLQIDDGASTGGFIVAGSTNYDNGSGPGFANSTAVFARFNQDCSPYILAWINNSSVGAEDDDFGIRVVQRGALNNSTDPYPFVFFGYTNSDSQNPSFNCWASKVENNGGGAALNILTSSPVNPNELLASVATINSGSIAEYVLAGTIKEAGAQEDKVFVTKIGDASLWKDSTLIPRTLDYSLGNLSLEGRALQKVTVIALQGSGYLVAANSVISGNSDIVLTKLTVDGSAVWDSPMVIGGPGDDSQAAIYEHPDGRLLVFGTMQIGDDRQSKMVLMKVNDKGALKD